MKSIGFILAYLASAESRRNLRIIARLLVALAVMVTLFSVVFHLVMEREGREFSWPSSVYWTLVTMSTLGFGDITFESDLGRIFSVVVLLSGSVFILVMLPFSFIQFVYLPWMAAQRAARAPRALPEETAGHIVLTALGPIEDALIRRADREQVPYTLLIGDLEDALALHERGYRVMLGALDDPQTYRAARVESAALVATTQPDTTNTNVVFTVREISERVPLLATASAESSVDILELAGCDRVLRLGEMLGGAFARRVLGPDGRSHVVGRFGELLVAEAVPTGTALVGRTLGESRLRQQVGVNVVGLWDRGELAVAGPDSRIEPGTVLVLVGSAEQLAAYDREFCGPPRPPAPVVVIGGGRVGRATGAALDAAGIDHRIVERLPERIRDDLHYVQGDAADLEVLRRAGIDEASSAVITTHDDDVNVYLTIYCRRLRPDLQILSRANLDRNVSTLHRAGADFVLSYASTGATAIWNVLRSDSTVLLAEGLDVFRVAVPPRLVGRTLAQSGIRAETGCSVVALERDGRFETNPDASEELAPDAELLLIGDRDAEDRFYARFAPDGGRRHRARGAAVRAAPPSAPRPRSR